MSSGKPLGPYMFAFSERTIRCIFILFLFTVGVIAGRQCWNVRKKKLLRMSRNQKACSSLYINLFVKNFAIPKWCLMCTMERQRNGNSDSDGNDGSNDDGVGKMLRFFQKLRDETFPVWRWHTTHCNNNTHYARKHTHRQTNIHTRALIHTMIS